MFYLKKIFNIPETYDLSMASVEFDQKILNKYNRSRPLGRQKKICYSPYKNMYFGHRGKVSSCCYNRNFILGAFPKQSINEIWFGEKSEQLRQAISSNNLDFGCEFCKSHILAENFDANKSKQYDRFKLNKKGYPSVLEFELSNVCNLECTMCSGEFSSLIRKNREKKEAIPQVYNGQFVEQLAEFIPHLEHAKFYGGEPFLVDIYFDIWNLIIKNNNSTRIEVQTNGTVLNKKIKNLLRASKFNLNISIDSLNKENYEKIRINGNFERLMQNLDWFLSYCKKQKTFVGISACLMVDNWFELPDFIRFCNKKGIYVYFHFVQSPFKNALKSLETSELKKILNTLSKESFPRKNWIQIKNRRHYFDALKQISYLIESRKLQSHGKMKKIESIEDFIQKISSFISSSPLIPQNEKKEKTAIVKNRLIELKKIMDAETLLFALRTQNFEDPVSINASINILIENSTQTLVNQVNNSNQ